MDIRRDSRLATTPLYTYIDDPDGTIYYFGLPKRVAFEAGDEYTIHSLGEGEQLWQTTSRIWGNPQLWWVLAQANDLPYPWGLTTGQDIKIPSKPTLARMLQ